MKKKGFAAGLLFMATATLVFHGAVAADVPQDWNIEIANPDCHAVSGVYVSLGVSDKSDSPYYAEPLLERNVFGFPEIDTEDHSVRIQVDVEENQLTITVIAKDRKVLSSKVFNEPFSCENGWVVYRTSVSGSGDGSSVKQTDTVTRFARSKSGELIVFHKAISVSRKWWFFRESHEFDVWYKFDAR